MQYFVNIILKYCLKLQNVFIYLVKPTYSTLIDYNKNQSTHISPHIPLSIPPSIIYQDKLICQGHEEGGANSSGSSNRQLLSNVSVIFCIKANKTFELHCHILSCIHMLAGWSE